MNKNLSPFDRGTRVVFAIVALIVMTFYKDASAQVAAFLFAGFCLYEAASGTCSAYRALGVHSIKDRLSAEARWFVAITGVQGILAYEWWSAGFEKIVSGTFPSMMAKILASFAHGNPYTWYADYLNNLAIPNATALGYIVEWGEVAVAVGLVAAVPMMIYGKTKQMKRAGSILAVVTLVAAMFMNANFYLASGWTGVSTQGLNALMFWVEGVLAYAYVAQVARS